MDAYDVHRRIGQGTFGVVYLAVHRKSGQPVRYDVIFYIFEVAHQLLPSERPWSRHWDSRPRSLSSV